MSTSSNNLRKSKDEVLKEFKEYKNANKPDLDKLKNLLSHRSEVPEIIEAYLDILKNEDYDFFLNELFLYYPIRPIEICKKFGVKKTETEKDRFFKLIHNLIDVRNQEGNVDINLINFLKKEINNCEEITHLIPTNELKKEIELKGKEKKAKEEVEKEKEREKEDLIPFKYSRWFISYNTEIDFKTEENEEFLFYHLSNSLISEFTKEQRCFAKRIDLIDSFIILFKDVYSKKNKGDIFSKYFEFLCMALTNCEKNKKYDEKLKPILDSIAKEFYDKYMNLNEIKEYLNKNNFQYEFIDKKIIIKYKGVKFFIDDYNLYNLNENVINELINRRRGIYKSFLEENIKFTEHLNRMKKNELLIKIIKKYSCSKLAVSSIEKLFNINKNDYKELFKELSENIEKYIYLMPYDCLFDTERTFENPMKIIIDPYKEKFVLDIKYINNNLELESVLEEFCNITFRKFCFEHEIHHLTTVLLIFLYVSEDSSINSLIKELKSDGEVVFHPEMDIEDLIKKKAHNFQKEAGNMFELLCYGNIQKEFTLKQLLFIANENNDQLEYSSFKKKYEEECKKTAIELLDEFPENQLLSGLVKKINECLKKNDEKDVIVKTLNSKFIVHKDENEYNNNINSILNDNNMILVNEFERYNNHLIIERRPIYKNK